MPDGTGLSEWTVWQGSLAKPDKGHSPWKVDSGLRDYTIFNICDECDGYNGSGAHLSAKLPSGLLYCLAWGLDWQQVVLNRKRLPLHCSFFLQSGFIGCQGLLIFVLHIIRNSQKQFSKATSSKINCNTFRSRYQKQEHYLLMDLLKCSLTNLKLTLILLLNIQLLQKNNFVSVSWLSKFLKTLL